jgi:drug/metabolite transporter (DMT)-like permease
MESNVTSIAVVTRDIGPAVTGDAAVGRAAPLRSRQGRGYALVLVSAALFGLGGSVSKVVLDAGIPAARLAALRATGAAAVLLVVLALTRPDRLRIALRDVPALAVLGLTGAALIQWLYFTAIDRLPVGLGVLLEFTGPLLVALYTWLVLGHAIGRTVWVALGLALGGLALVAEVWNGGSLDALGVAAGLAAAVCLATFYLLSGRTLVRYHATTVAFWMFTVAAAFWAVVQPWWTLQPSLLVQRVTLPGALDSVSMPLWLCIGWIVVLGTLVPYSLEIAALGQLTPTTTGIVAMSEPVFAAAVAWWWLGQELGPVQIVGAVILLCGVVLVEVRGAHPADVVAVALD